MHAYIAKERGYFAQEGLDLDVLVARGQICTMALLNGQMELSSNPNIFDAMVAGRFKGKVIYVSAKTLGHRFIVAPEIKSFDGLKQKNIAVSTFGGLTDMLTREILEQHGINPAKDVDPASNRDTGCSLCVLESWNRQSCSTCVNPRFASR